MRPSRSSPSRSSELPPGSESWDAPWVQLKYFTYHPCVYSRFFAGVHPSAKRGDLVAVYDRDGERFGSGFYNPGARVPLRVFAHGKEALSEAGFHDLLRRAALMRKELFHLDEVSDAYRVVHSDGDSLSGLIVDRYADVLRVDVHSFGVWQRLDAWLPTLHEVLGTKRHIIRVDPEIAEIESIRVRERASADEPRSVKIREHGARYEVNFEEGHKTGFFCDQRDNRLALAKLAGGKSVLDLCCYTGGFSVAAKVLGSAAEVTAVDLDEKAIEQGRRNANLNQARIQFVHADAFKYARQMRQNGNQWDIVVLDPPKMVFSREDGGEGGRKYEDLNRLAIGLVPPGGIFVTCSCSGLLSQVEFERIVIKAAHREQRKLQFFNKTGASVDHPVMSNCEESTYLKVLWARVY